MVSLQFHDVLDDTVLSIQTDDFLLIHLESKGEEISWGIHLDRITAIKFSKELRKQIALLEL